MSSQPATAHSAELYYRRRTGSLTYERFDNVAAAVEHATLHLGPQERSGCTIESERQDLRFEKGRFVVTANRRLAA